VHRAPRTFVGLLLRSAAAAACLCGAGTAPAAAQSSSLPDTHGFLARADFSFGFAKLTAADVRFKWMSDVSFDLDVVDYGAGRLRFVGLYEATMGRERRPYDLNQGYYAFDVSASRRAGATEVSGLVRHVSRHLTDRENAPSISWNEVGGRIEHRRAWLVMSLDATRAMQQAFVDYVWIARATVTARHPVAGNLDVQASGSGAVIGVDERLKDRDRLCGGRIEGGLRIGGRAADLELFVGYERRIDGFPTDRFRVRWFTLGFRIVSAD
jgi:hypothetical protein